MMLDVSTGLATSVWLTVVLVVVLASIASLTLSRVRQTSGVRPRVLAVASIAAIVLLAAAVFIALAPGHLPALLPGIGGPETSAARGAQMADEPWASEPASAAAAAARPAESSSATASASVIPGPAASDPADQGSLPDRAVLLLTDASSAREANPYVVAPATEEPWGAMACVRSYRRDPENVSRWTIENECSRPVAIVLARCATDAAECDARALWSHESGVFALPMKLQRPVFAADETREGRVLRLLACHVTSPRAIELIGEGLETRSTDAWQENWDAVVLRDECLSRVERLSELGRRTGRMAEATGH